jgi:hypothetical protein
MKGYDKLMPMKYKKIVSLNIFETNIQSCSIVSNRSVVLSYLSEYTCCGK